MYGIAPFRRDDLFRLAPEGENADRRGRPGDHSKAMSGEILPLLVVRIKIKAQEFGTAALQRAEYVKNYLPAIVGSLGKNAERRRKPGARKLRSGSDLKNGFRNPATDRSSQELLRWRCTSCASRQTYQRTHFPSGLS